MKEKNKPDFSRRKVNGIDNKLIKVMFSSAKHSFSYLMSFWEPRF